MREGPCTQGRGVFGTLNVSRWWVGSFRVSLTQMAYIHGQLLQGGWRVGNVTFRYGLRLSEQSNAEIVQRKTFL